MNYEPYTIYANSDSTRFQFQSIGKRGIVEKLILISPLSGDIYNLSLLDYDPYRNEYSDQSTTDNGDMQIVLATAISAIKVFMSEHTGKYIYFTGSTESRTRLYQIAIFKVYDQLKYDFNIYGIKNEIALDFEPNFNYDGFLVQKKPLNSRN